MNIWKEEFEIGDKVWVQRKDLENSRSAKFEDKRIGPFIIQSKLNNGAYKLQNLEYWNIIIVTDWLNITKNKIGNL